MAQNTCMAVLKMIFKPMYTFVGGLLVRVNDFFYSFGVTSTRNRDCDSMIEEMLLNSPFHNKGKILSQTCFFPTWNVWLELSYFWSDREIKGEVLGVD